MYLNNYFINIYIKTKNAIEIHLKSINNIMILLKK